MTQKSRTSFMDVPLCLFEFRYLFKARALDCQTQYLPQIQLHLSMILDDSTDKKKRSRKNTNRSNCFLQAV